LQSIGLLNTIALRRSRRQSYGVPKVGIIDSAIPIRDKQKENVNPVLINLLGKIAADEAIGLTNDI
jgi:hypothetical protein